MIIKRLMLAFALLVPSACNDRDKASTEKEARAVADAATGMSDPNRRPDGLRVEAIDMQDRWRFAYYEGGVGGPTIVVVNKHNGQVVHSETSQ